MANTDKVLEHYERPKNVGSFAKDESDVGTGVVTCACAVPLPASNSPAAMPAI